MTRLKGIDMVLLFDENNDGEEVAKQMSDFVNNYSFDFIGFIEGLMNQNKKTQNLFTIICFLWIDKLNYFLRKNWYDGRNEYSVEIANKIKDELEGRLEKIVEGYKEYNISESFLYDGNLPFELMFVEIMSRQHRTLQQCFSSIAYKWLSVVKDLQIEPDFVECSKIISSNMDERFYRTPLI